MNPPVARPRRGTAFALLVAFAVPGWSALAGAQSDHARQHYEKSEHHVRMRDGVELYTAVYRPRDRSRRYPFLMNRTPYSCQPYGADNFRDVLGPSRAAMEDGFIVVYQDVRGRYMSDGLYDNMRPHVPGGTPQQIDESSDTYDTIEWLLASVEGHNGRVGIWGISYPGFYTAAALPEAHPALVAASPQAPVSDFYFDDFHHQGAYTLAYFLITAVFGYQKEERTTTAWYPMARPSTVNAYRFYLKLGPLTNGSDHFGEDNFFWRQLVEHPNYDEFWQARNILPHLDDVHTATLVVGGWFDAEDLYGPLNIYRTLEENCPETFSTLVMGPWSHGDWARTSAMQVVGDIAFGVDLSETYQREVELPFFRHFLKDGPEPDLPEALTFDTGRKEWQRFEQWPPAAAEPATLHLGAGGQLAFTPAASAAEEYSEFVSDPARPVPYREDSTIVFTPRRYMSEDQRFASARPDVLTFLSEVLEEDVTLAGPILARLRVSTTGTAADWVVKLIDVYPDDLPTPPRLERRVVLAGYQQMVRSEALRGRFRNGFEHPEPFVPGQVTEVDVPLQDVLHTFRKGHRIMVHVQSTWFPLIDRNPQKFVDNIFLAEEDDFVKATHRVFHSPTHPSGLEARVLKSPPASPAAASRSRGQ